MTEIEILEKLSTIKNGHYIRFTKKKDLGNNVIKISEMRMRKGINYANMSINKDKETQPLKWGQWVDGLFPNVIKHKDSYYLRVTAVDPEHPERCADTLSTRYMLDGVEISKEEAIKISGEIKPAKPSAVYSIKFNNILSIKEEVI